MRSAAILPVVVAISCAGLVAAASAETLSPAATPASLKPPAKQAPGDRIQYVLISFDGAVPNPEWDRSLAIAAETGAHFTYFLSCTGLVAWPDHMTYSGPGHATGRSNIGFATSRKDVATRLSNIWTAHLEGHEIGSHACGHFDGKAWSQSDWQEELTTFRRIVRDAWTANGARGEPPDWKDFAAKGIVGFRAPYLSSGPALDGALAAEGFRYSASSVSQGPALPRTVDGIVQFALPTIPEGPKSRRVVAMDYNLFVRHSGGKEDAADAPQFEDRAYDAFKAAFDRQYDGQRIPLQLGFHFTLMNGGAYWRALEHFALDVCGRPDVRCTTYSDYLKQTGVVLPAAGGRASAGRGPA